MEFPASLSAQLSELTDALDDPGTDLQAILAVLIDDVTAAVPSFLGSDHDAAVGRGTGHADRDRSSIVELARSSLQLPLDPLAGAGPDSVVVFYARDADAFAELAADTRRMYGLDGQVLARPAPARPRPHHRRPR